MSESDPSEEMLEQWYERKTAMMEASLGAEHDMVMHAIIPFAVGGGLDLYYYPHGLPGCGIATKEVCPSPAEAPSNDELDAFEFVMFTRHAIDLDAAGDPATPFGAIHKRINAILNAMASYAQQATLNGNDTCEFPPDFEGLAGACLILDGYDSHEDDDAGTFGLMAVIEIFRSEMDFARKVGGAVLIDRLKANGHYPYSDLDREPVA